MTLWFLALGLIWFPASEESREREYDDPEYDSGSLTSFFDDNEEEEGDKVDDEENVDESDDEEDETELLRDGNFGRTLSTLRLLSEELLTEDEASLDSLFLYLDFLSDIEALDALEILFDDRKPFST